MRDSPTPRREQSWLERLGLGRPELRAWAMYDWANSVFMTIILLVYPIYFTRVAGADLAPVVATARIAFATAISMTLIAVLSPILGAMADHAGIKKDIWEQCYQLGINILYYAYVEQDAWREAQKEQ